MSSVSLAPESLRAEGLCCSECRRMAPESAFRRRKGKDTSWPWDTVFHCSPSSPLSPANCPLPFHEGHLQPPVLFSLRPNSSALWPWDWPFLPFRLRHNRAACSQNRTTQPGGSLGGQRAEFLWTPLLCPGGNPGAEGLGDELPSPLGSQLLPPVCEYT